MSSAPASEPERSPLAEAERVELTLPPRPDLVFLARMTAAAVASRADFGFDQVEDLRLAIDELCITVAGEEGSDGRLHLLFEWSGGVIRVTATLTPLGAATGPTRLAAPRANELSERILDALVDEHGTGSVDGAPQAWIVVRRSTTST